MGSSDIQIDKPQRGRPKSAELPHVINTGVQSINTERDSFKSFSHRIQPPHFFYRNQELSCTHQWVFWPNVRLEGELPLHRNCSLRMGESDLKLLFIIMILRWCTLINRLKPAFFFVLQLERFICTSRVFYSTRRCCACWTHDCVGILSRHCGLQKNW